jgi:hypothetical protein
MKSTTRHLAVGLLALILLTISLGTAAQDTRGDVFVYFTEVNSLSSCDEIRMRYIRNRTGDLIFVGQGWVNGVKFHDQVLPFNGPSYGLSGWGFFFNNDRGDATNLYPLTPGQPIDVSVTVFTTDWQPIYETRARLKSCDSTEMVRSSSGPATQLLMNHSFELARLDGSGIEIPAEAAFWKGNNTIDDERTCDGPPSATSSVFNGACGFKFTADLLTTSKLKQKFTGTVGAPGDLAYLLVHAQGFAGYTGGAKVKAKLTLANGTIVKLVPDAIPAGPSTYGAAYDASAKLTSPIVSAKVILQQKPGSNSVAFDAVSLSVFSNTPTPLRALPMPAPRDSNSFENQ